MKLQVKHHTDIDTFTMTEVNVAEIANPAAVGWRWTSPSGDEHEITWFRGLSTLVFSTKIDDRWDPSPITNDDYAMRKPTLAEARRVAHKFIRA